MGNDGGSIPKRRELVKESARLPSVSELKSTLLESLGHAWTHCAISDEKLDMDNAVSDWRGRLFNYEAVLQGLMPYEETDDGSGKAQRFAETGITSLRDVVKLKFKKYAPPGQKAESDQIWACPVSLKEIGPATKAVYLVPCGHVFAELAMDKITDLACPECSEMFEKQNIIPILPREDAELERLRQRMVDLKEKSLSHNLKKDKSNGKKKKRKAEDGKEDVVKGAEKENGASKDQTKKAHINNPMTASLTAKVMAEQEERNKRRKIAAAR
ncbi:hypothetical protein PspLS_10854 [Pyricularia sp. CBS 133598]|nr:hypothetical protein PspLS_10854 [Pyricularia sp. CBS 133598]